MNVQFLNQGYINPVKALVWHGLIGVYKWAQIIYTISFNNRGVSPGYNFEKIWLQILNSVVKLINIFFKEILNSNFKKTGIVLEKIEFRLANLLKNKWKHQDK